MKLRFFILFIFSLSLVCRSSAQLRNDFTQSRILFLLDESSSMLQTWSTGQPKFKIANELIERLMDSINAVNPQVQYSLRVFGNYHTVMEHDCTDTRNEVPFSPDNHTQMAFRLEDMHPLGVTAIAYSLSEAAEHDLVDAEHNAYSIILITDGGESCNGDICGVMEKLIRNKVYFRPYVLSLEDVPNLKTEYACMGNYLTVTKKGDINKAVSTIVEAFRPMLKLSKVEYQKIQTIAANAPSALKVTTSPIKAEIPVLIDSVKPKPKPADTAVTPKPSKIIVGDDPKRPVSIKMNRAPFPKTVRMSVVRKTPAALAMVAATPPDIKTTEEPVVIPRPAPVTMKKGTLPKLIAMATTKPALTPLPTVSATPPEIKPEVVAPPRAVSVAMKPIAIPALKKKKLPRPVFEEMTAVVATAPEIKVTVPVVRPAPIKIAKAKTPDYKKFAVAKPAPFVAPTIVANAPVIPLKVEAIPHTAFKMESIAVTGLKKFKTNAPTATAFKKINATAPVIKYEEPEPVAPPPPVVVRTIIKLSPKVKPGAFRMHLLYVNTFLDSDLKPLKLPPVPEFKYKEPIAEVPKPKPTPPAVKPKPGKPAPPPAAPKEDALSVVHEDATETTLQVYLTNGKGKYFTTTPRMKLMDGTTRKEIKHFFRTVDEAGNPDIINDVAVGKYELTIDGREDLVAHVDLQQNKHNKVYIKVKDFTLFFKYANAPTRPVKEFTATVIQRNMDNGKVTVQKCTERLEYEPGNYHIVINTFPEDIRNADVDELERGVTIPQPGFTRFTSEVGNIQLDLFKELGDKFVKFATINLNDPRTQPLQIQPGKYQAHYSNGTTKFSTSDRVVSFAVISLQTTEVTLKK